MQILVNSSKHLISALLSFTLLIAWNGGNTDISGWGFNNICPFTTSVKNSRTAKQDDSIWASISKDLNLDHQDRSPRVQAEIRDLLSDQTKLHQILEAAGPYIYFIHKQTQAKGLPAELALIPVIESEFNPNDHSKAGATGLWQLMPQTARELGIKIKSGYDGRRNVVDSTKAALAYFNDLGNDFKGNWYMAIAAYNCGQVKLHHVSKRTGSKNYWNLPLPKETKHYVPRLLAVAAIIKNPKKYGVELPPVSNSPVFTEVKMKKEVNLKHVAKSTGIDEDTLLTLNPDYNHGRLVEKKGAYTFLVPIEKESAVKAHLSGNVVNS